MKMKTTYTKFLDAPKAALKRKFIVLYAYNRRIRPLRICELQLPP